MTDSDTGHHYEARILRSYFGPSFYLMLYALLQMQHAQLPRLDLSTCLTLDVGIMSLVSKIYSAFSRETIAIGVWLTASLLQL